MDERIKVLHIKRRLSSDGATVAELNLASQLKDRVRFDWVLESEEGSQNDWAYKFEDLGSKIFYFSFQQSGALARQKEKIKKYYSFFKTEKYDIIHIDTDSLERVNVLLLAKLTGVSCRIVHSHNSQSEGGKLSRNIIIQKILRKLMGRWSTDKIACSEVAAKWLFPLADCSKVTILKNGINIKRFRFDPLKREKARKELGVQDSFLIGHVGRFSKVKNHSFLVDIFYEISRKDENARFLLIGQGDLEYETQRKVQKLGIEGKVTFLGVTDSVEDYLSAMDVFVLPSLFVGLPLVTVEAQTSGLPCILSDAISKETKITDETRFLPLQDGPVCWAAEILSMKKEGNIKIRENAWKKIVDAGYDIENCSEELYRIYQQKSRYVPDIHREVI